MPWLLADERTCVFVFAHVIGYCVDAPRGECIVIGQSMCTGVDVGAWIGANLGAYRGAGIRPSNSGVVYHDGACCSCVEGVQQGGMGEGG